MPQQNNAQGGILRILRQAMSFKRLQRDERGSVAVEFALLTVPFFAILFFIIENALVLWVRESLATSVVDTGRLIRTGQVQTANMGKDAFRSRVCQNMHIMSTYCETNIRVDVREFTSFADVTFQPPFDDDGNFLGTDATQYQPGQRQSVIIMSLFLRWSPALPILSSYSNTPDGDILMSASTVFRNEPFK
ncbi:MAG: hypothetical protein COB90_08525 [Hyphomicrobiales bacterium]|nr:MAG: hypothetical protein COB90_08525 [Hyphomicrobiales bacterium]